MNVDPIQAEKEERETIMKLTLLTANRQKRASQILRTLISNLPRDHG
jgi:hypothetical protein